MNYSKIYSDLISKSKKLEQIRLQEKKNKINYFERHHIIPKCLGGNNSKENLVLLTAKEHYISHLLLCEIYVGNKQLIYALWCMVSRGSKDKKRYITSSRTYERIRREFAIASSIKNKNQIPWNKGLTSETNISVKRSSEKNKGQKRSYKTKQNISFSLKGKSTWNKGKHHSEYTKNKISKSKKDPSEEIRNKMRTAALNRPPMSEETKQNIRLSHKNKPKIECPHCHKIGGNSNMKHYHFDNCYLLTGKKLTCNKIECSNCHKLISLSNIKRHIKSCLEKTLLIN